MFNFIKKLFGAKTPVNTAAQAPYKVEPPKEVVITRALAPASNPDVIVTPVANTDAPAKKRRRPRNRKPKTANTTAPKVTEGKTKGGNGAVKQPKANAKKPKAPAKAK